MRALVLNCTLKSSPETSNTEAVARVVMEAMESDGIETEIVRVVDHDIKPGVSTDEGSGRGLRGARTGLDLLEQGPRARRLLPRDRRRQGLVAHHRPCNGLDLAAVARALAEQPVPAPPS